MTAAPKVFTYEVTIQKTHLDMFNHVNNAVYLNLFEEARWDLITKGGYGIERIKATGLGPTILEIKLSFLKELHLHDRITIETKMLFYKNKIGKLAQRMLRNGEECCLAEFTIGLFDLQKRKLVLPTPAWLKAIGIQTNLE
ncbi:MAG: thioesterase [Gammaproteobacteria bacterium RIFCSPHIGHO2_12_FULL_42_13]|nr:MAG: thioesterase [Gammaproteobacteria bacterium RIFCSPHIGHO2_12_FULL_42_13]